MARKLASLLVVAMVSVAFFGAAHAGRSALTPQRFLAETDGDLVQVENPVDGVRWAAWTWRDGAETSIAIASLDKAAGLWTEPLFVGRDDAEDQGQPGLAVDANGSLYLAYAEQSRGVIKIMALARGADAWTLAQVVSGRGEQAAAPTVRTIENRLVLAYIAGGRVVLKSYPLIEVRQAGMLKLSDGPDPIGYTYPPVPEEDEEKEEDKPFDSPLEFFDFDLSDIGLRGRRDK